MDEILNYFKNLEKDAKENANELYKQYGDTEEYKLKRIAEFEVGKRFKYDGLKYEVIELRGFGICYKRLGFTLKRAPSGRRLKTYGLFGLTSIMDLKLKFI